MRKGKQDRRNIAFSTLKRCMKYVFEQVIFVHMREYDQIYFLLKQSMYYLAFSLGYRLTPEVNKGRCTSCLRIAANNVNGAMFFVFIHQVNDGCGCERWCFLCHHPLHTPTNSCYSLRTTCNQNVTASEQRIGFFTSGFFGPFEKTHCQRSKTLFNNDQHK